MTTQARFEIRRGAERGATDLGWLRSRHSFSFGGYRDPDRMGFRSLRVFNDDVVEPSSGFGEHGHDNMEIISWVFQGELTHEDSTGTRGVIRPGDAQVMSARSVPSQVSLASMVLLPQTGGVQPETSSEQSERQDRVPPAKPSSWQVMFARSSPSQNSPELPPSGLLKNRSALPSPQVPQSGSTRPRWRQVKTPARGSQ